MFNFKELLLDKRNDETTDPFVGIRKNENGDMVFRLPVGFDNFPEGDFNAIKQLFFRMYRTFKKFESDNKSLFQDVKPKEKDNIQTGGNSYQFKDKDDNEVLLYSKISVIENLLETYQDLALDVIERRVGRNEEIDFSKIDNYLHKAVYLPENDVIYLDEMDLARQTLQYESANLVELFCFIVSELQQELEQDIDIRVQELANKFREQNLTHEQSLFNEETFEITMSHLKELLDNIDRNTTYKDDDYWQLYEGIETFLYGEIDMKNTHPDGIFWGISRFSKIWEDMCHTYAFKNYSDICYADTNLRLDENPKNYRQFGGRSVFCKQSFENPFFIEFRGEKRWMRPDLVHKIENNVFNDVIAINILKENGGRIDFTIRLREPDKRDIYDELLNALKKGLLGISGATFRENKFIRYVRGCLEYHKELCLDKYKDRMINRKFIVLDWKYHNHKSMILHDKKIENDVIKQLTYELALSQTNSMYRIESHFFIPFFYMLTNNTSMGEFIPNNMLNHSLSKSGIKVFKADFLKIQQNYLSEP